MNANANESDHGGGVHIQSANESEHGGGEHELENASEKKNMNVRANEHVGSDETNASENGWVGDVNANSSENANERESTVVAVCTFRTREKRRA